MFSLANRPAFDEIIVASECTNGNERKVSRYAKKSLSNGGGSLNLDNVKCFISLAECLNFTKAAEKEHMTQTSMSRKISGLEEELGVRLFYRDNHQVILTDAGSEFYVQAQKLLDVYESTVRLVQNVEQGYARSLKIGVGIYEDELLDTFLGQYVMGTSGCADYLSAV